MSMAAFSQRQSRWLHWARRHLSTLFVDCWQHVVSQKEQTKCDFSDYKRHKLMVNVWFPELHEGASLTGVHVMSAGLGLCLRLGLRHHGGAERVHRSGLAGPRCSLGNESRRPWGGARAARVKGRGAAMETSPVVPTGPNTAVAQVHRQILLWRQRRDFILRRGACFTWVMLNDSYTIQVKSQLTWSPQHWVVFLKNVTGFKPLLLCCSGRFHMGIIK